MRHPRFCKPNTLPTSLILSDKIGFSSPLSLSVLNGDRIPISGFKDRHVASPCPLLISLRVHTSPNPDQSSQIRPNSSYFIVLFNEREMFSLNHYKNWTSDQNRQQSHHHKRKTQLRRPTRGTRTKTLKEERPGSYDMEFLDPTMPEARIY